MGVCSGFVLSLLLGGHREAMGWTTSSICRRLNQTDPEPAWRALVERFHTPLVNFARQLDLPPDEAEDAAQDTLVACVSSLRNGCYDRSKGRLTTWLFGIALRVVLNARRRLAIVGQRVQTGRGTSFWDSVPAAPEDTSQWLRDWKRALLEGYLEDVCAQFEPRTFRAFELVVRAQRPPIEVADSLGITVKSVYNAKHRVLKRIRELREAHEQTLLEEITCLATTRKN